MDRPRNVLFLCTGNSARSIIAEATLNHVAGGRLRGYSAGSHPAGKLNPVVMAYLAEMGIPTPGARSKSWDEFAGPDAPRMDYVITVCDNAAGEACPVWPGHPVTAHWSVEDPGAYPDDPVKARKVTEEAFRVLRNRIELLVSAASPELR
jgi:arsenate reductase (thioredoxin)